MKLTDLNPRWLAEGGEPRREAVGIEFDCPCGCALPVFVYVNPPLDGGPPAHAHAWNRTGDNFETLTLTPSIQRAEPGGCRWHGFVTNGEIVTC